MIKNKASIELAHNERYYMLICDADSPLGDVELVLEAMKTVASNKIAELVKEQKEEEEQKDGGQS